jgi:hypothetical protein
MAISSIEPVSQKVRPNQIVVNNNSPIIYGKFLLIVENRSYLRIFEVPDMTIMTVVMEVLSVNTKHVWKPGMFSIWCTYH